MRARFLPARGLFNGARFNGARYMFHESDLHALLVDEIRAG
jgi:hypothetical protein